MGVIRSTGFDQIEMIKDILELHAPEKRIDADPTYSKGVFYKSGKIKQPRFKFDIDASQFKAEADENQSEMEWRFNPLRDVVIVEKSVLDLSVDDTGGERVGCVMFDPPFVCGSRRNGKPGIIKSRFSFFKTHAEMLEFYRRAMVNLADIIRPGGVLIFKCQDTVDSGRNKFTHIDIANMAEPSGYALIDIFVLVAKTRLISPNMANQKHARKFHSYFMVLRREK